MNESDLRHASGSIQDDVLVITILAKQIRDPKTSCALRDEILALVGSAEMSGLVIDLQRVTFIGSIGLLAFLGVRRHLEAGRIVLCNLADPIRRMFEVCRLVAVDSSMTAPFEVADSLKAALAGLSE